MSKIYTRTGDSGETSLLSGQRVKKSHQRIQALGSIDELNAILGVIRSQSDIHSASLIKNIQEHLFSIGAEISSPKKIKNLPTIKKNDISFLEKHIDSIQKKIPPLKNFIIPGETQTGAFCDLARAVCRRAERNICALDQKEKINPHILPYINRLSDLLFMLERLSYFKSNVKETLWKIR